MCLSTQAERNFFNQLPSLLIRIRKQILKEELLRMQKALNLKPKVSKMDLMLQLISLLLRHLLITIQHWRTSD